MSFWWILLIMILIIINYYYIDQVQKMSQDVKEIKQIVKKNT